MRRQDTPRCAVAGRRLRVGRQARNGDGGRRRLLDLLRELHVAGREGEQGSPQLVVVRRLVRLPRERRLSVRRETESVALHNLQRLPSSSNSFTSFAELTSSPMSILTSCSGRGPHVHAVLPASTCSQARALQLERRRPFSLTLLLSYSLTLFLSYSLTLLLSDSLSLFLSFSLSLVLSLSLFLSHSLTLSSSSSSWRCSCAVMAPVVHVTTVTTVYGTKTVACWLPRHALRACVCCREWAPLMRLTL